MSEVRGALAEALRTASPAIGWAAAALSAILSLPQVVRLLRSRSHGGVRLLPWQGLLASNVAWLIYGLETDQLVVAVPNAMSGALAVATLAILSRRQASAVLLALGVPVLFAVASVGLTLEHPFVFGIVTIAPSVVGWIDQIASLLRWGRPETLSLAGILLYLLCQSCWLVYGLARGDIALSLSATALTLSLAATAVAYLVVTPR